MDVLPCEPVCHLSVEPPELLRNVDAVKLLEQWVKVTLSGSGLWIKFMGEGFDWHVSRSGAPRYLGLWYGGFPQPHRSSCTSDAVT